MLFSNSRAIAISNSFLPPKSCLFDSDGFQAATKHTYPKDAHVLDQSSTRFSSTQSSKYPAKPSRYTIDAPYFWGASRYQYQFN